MKTPPIDSKRAQAATRNATSRNPTRRWSSPGAWIVRLGLLVAMGGFTAGVNAAGVSAPGVVTVERQARFADLLGHHDRWKRYEASGVAVAHGAFYVVFDNDGRIARVDPTLKQAELLGEPGREGYEGVACLAPCRQLFLLHEAARNKKALNGYYDRVTDKNRWIERRWLDHKLKKRNKGFEGVTLVSRGGQHYLLALCEGNRCTGSKKGGAGRIQVFQLTAEEPLKPVATIALPTSLQFIDYSGMDIDSDHRLVITSQRSSALWTGRLHPERWTLIGEGERYHFPRDKAGKPLYCAVEGVAWIGPQRVVVVSDQVDPDTMGEQCLAHDQSIHIVKL